MGENTKYRICDVITHLRTVFWVKHQVGRGCTKKEDMMDLTEEGSGFYVLWESRGV